MIRSWLREQIDDLMAWGQEPEENIFEDAAAIVREAGDMVVKLGWPESADLFADSRKQGKVRASTHAVTFLARCLTAAMKNMGPEPRPQKKRPLREQDERAYQQWLFALEGLTGPEDTKDMSRCYRWVKNHSDPGDPELPAEKTWIRFVGHAKTYFRVSREKSPRHGREVGCKSIVTVNQIEYPGGDDNGQE